MTDFVSVDECAQFRELAADGFDQQQIAARMDRNANTIRIHVRDRCHHEGREVPDRPISDDEIISLMHECAAEYGRIPSEEEWNAWDGRPRSSKSVIQRFGTAWRDAIKAAGFPVVAKGATTAIRAAAYQKPELCLNPAEVDD